MNGENGKRREFEGFSLDAERKILWRTGEIVPLPPKAVEMLIVLVKNRGEVVSKSELLEAVWGETFVEESVLSNNVYLLRKTLNELAGVKNLIQTVPLRGYRFGGKKDENDSDFILEHHVFEQTIVEEIPAADTKSEELKIAPIRKEESSEERISLPKNVGLSQRFSVSAPFAAVILLVGIAGCFAVWQIKQRTTNAKDSLPQIKSIAVLPFKTIGGETDEAHRGLALADVLISRLSGIRELNVRPTNAVFNLENEETSVIGEKLKVDAVLEGTIYLTGDKARVTARLINVADNASLWSGQFEKPLADELTMQDEIAFQVVDALALNLSGGERDHLTKRYTNDSDAFALYQKARFYWNKRNHAGMKEAERLFRNAIERDSNFALAYVGLADTIAMESDARESFTSVAAALRLDPNLAEAHATYGFLLTFHKWEWREAEAEFVKSIELNPNYATAHHWYAQLLLIEGRLDEAKREMRRALDINPLSYNFWADLGQIYLFNHEYEEAKIYVRKALEIYPQFTFAHQYMSAIYQQTGENDAALESYLNTKRTEWSESLSENERGDKEKSLETFKKLYKTGGFQALETEALKKLEGEDAKNTPQRNPNSFLDRATIYYNLGDKQKALDNLEEAHRQRAFMIVFLKVAPEFEPMRDEPRFQEILRKMNLL